MAVKRALARKAKPPRGRARRPAPAAPPARSLRPADAPIRVLVAKPGLDGHDRGAKVVAAALRDTGFEVVYSGLHQTPEQVVEAALQEDVDVVGLSMHSGAHMTLVPRILKLLRERGAADKVVVVGGIVPDEDLGPLKAEGVAEVFGPGTPTQAFVSFLREAVRERRSAGGTA